MVEHQIPYEKIVYFPGVVPEIDNLIKTIEETNEVALTPWGTWFAGDASGAKYGEIKYLQAQLIEQESSEALKQSTSYVLETLVESMAACAATYAELYKVSHEELKFAEHALRNPRTKYGINKYSEGQYMGPHVDWNESNSDITYTIVVYLNDNYEGGELYFVDPAIELKIKPLAGSIVMFPSTLPYLHQSCTITKGRKMLITHHWKNDSLSQTNPINPKDGS